MRQVNHRACFCKPKCLRLVLNVAPSRFNICLRKGKQEQPVSAFMLFSTLIHYYISFINYSTY